MSMLFYNALVSLRGLALRRRSSDAADPTLLAKIDVCWSANCGLGVTDCIRGAEFNARGTLLSLRAGDPYRIVRSLSMQATYTSAGGSLSQRRTAKLLEASEMLAQGVLNPHALGLVAMARGLTAYMEGSWDAGIADCDRAT